MNFIITIGMKIFKIKFGFSCTQIKNFGHVELLAIEDVDIFRQDVPGFSYILTRNFGHDGRLAT